MRALSVESGAGRLDLGGTVKARLGVKGTGLPPVKPQWFEGAGNGARWRGSRVLRRPLEIPFKVTGPNRAAVWASYSALARILDPLAGLVRLRVNLDGEVWYSDLARVGGGDWDWAADTDGSSFILTTIAFEAGDPYWTREDETSREIRPGGLGRGLLKGGSLSELQLSTTTGFGTVNFDNPGDVAVAPVWTAYAPFTAILLESPSGEVLEWTGDKPDGWLRIDAGAGTVVDEVGANRYAGLNSVPRFWAIPPGATQAQIVATDPDEDTRVVVAWRPKRWVLF